MLLFVILPERTAEIFNRITHRPWRGLVNALVAAELIAAPSG